MLGVYLPFVYPTGERDPESWRAADLQPSMITGDHKQKGLTPQQSCPPGGASCVWQWPNLPPGRTAASLSQTHSAGSCPGAQGAAPLAAGPSPERGKKG